jgi:hypothetical protein
MATIKNRTSRIFRYVSAFSRRINQNAPIPSPATAIPEGGRAKLLLDLRVTQHIPALAACI